jgi:hypothetical protein
MYIYINKLDLNLSVCLCLYLGLCLCHPLSVYFSGRAPSGDCVLYALRSRHHTCCLLRGVGEDLSFPTRMSRAQWGTARQRMFLNAVQRQMGFGRVKERLPRKGWFDSFEPKPTAVSNVRTCDYISF